MKENKTIKTISIAVISILIITIIGLGIYIMFIKKDDDKGINNNKNNTQDNYVDTKVSYGTSDDVHLEYPEGIDNKNLTKNEVKPIKSINYIPGNGERVKIDENLTIIFNHRANENSSSYDTFNVIYKNKELNMDIERKKVTQLSIEVDEEISFAVYKLGEKHLIKANSAIGQNDWDWLLLINENGELTWLTDEVYHGGLSHGLLSKVEYVSSNLKNFYQLTIEGFSESDGPPDWEPEDTILYIYKK